MTDYHYNEKDLKKILEKYDSNFVEEKESYYVNGLFNGDFLYFYNNVMYDGKKVVTVGFSSHRSNTDSWCGGSCPCENLEQVLKWIQTYLDQIMKLNKDYFIKSRVKQLSIFDMM